MSDIDIDVEVSDTDLANLEDALMEGLEDGMEESIAWMVRNGQHKAKSRIRSTDRVWRRRVYHGWKQQETVVTETGGGVEGDGGLINTADHAKVVDVGLAPAGTIEGANPKVQDIIQWVSENLYPAPHAGVNLEDWHDDLQALAAEYSPGYVMTAFAVKHKLDEKGYPGIDFTGAAESYLRQVGPMVVQRKVEKRMNRKLRQYGLK